MQQQRTILWFLVPLAVALRLVFAASRQLVPDEAFYWVLSRHPSMGYLDHPPMVAYLIRVGTLVFGSNELGVRCMAVAAAFGALLVLLWLCKQLVGDRRALVLLGVMWLCSPLFAGLATIMTPDTPAIFFSICAMACAIEIARCAENPHPGSPTEYRGKGQLDAGSVKADPANSSSQSSVLSPQSSLGLWLAFGLFTGLAMLSKYTAVLPAGAVVLAMLSTEPGRREFRRPGIWMAGVVALLIFSPVIDWNATHEWASFKFQLRHGLNGAESTSDAAGAGTWAAKHFGSVGQYFLGQVGIFTPIFFIFGVVVLAIRWREYRTLGLPQRILVWSATVPLVFFALTAFKSGSAGQANWPAFAYFPMSLLLVEHVARLWKKLDVKLLWIGCALGLAIMIPLHWPELLYRVTKNERFLRKLNEFYGWRELGHSVGANHGREVMVAGSHQDAAELAFYMPGQPEVWVYNFPGSDGKPVSRPTAFDYFPERPDLAKVDRVLFFYGDVQDFCRAFGFKVVARYNFRKSINGRIRERSYFLLERR